MRVELATRKPGDHRFEYHIHWYAWALPLSVALSTNFYPTPEATLELDHRWETQRVLIIRVLCVAMRVVLVGPLFPPETDE